MKAKTEEIMNMLLNLPVDLHNELRNLVEGA